LHRAGETMNEKIHHALDGELPATALNPQEADVFAQTNDVITRVVNSIPRTAGVDVGPAVMARIRAHHTTHPAAEPAWKIALAWLWSPRSLSLQWRPAYAAAFAVLLVVAVTFTNPTTRSSATSPHQVLVQFRLDAPQAQQVQLAGNFTSWKADVSLKRSASGVWTVVLPLTPGVHNYAFVVDGNHWVADPMAQSVSDGFGGMNSQLAVLTSDETVL
jgi:hypothetical protein